MPDNLEEIKQVTKDFYEKQSRLMELMLSISDEEFKEFSPWFDLITNENLKRKYKNVYPRWDQLYKSTTDL